MLNSTGRRSILTTIQHSIETLGLMVDIENALELNVDESTAMKLWLLLLDLVVPFQVTRVSDICQEDT